MESAYGDVSRRQFYRAIFLINNPKRCILFSQGLQSVAEAVLHSLRKWFFRKTAGFLATDLLSNFSNIVGKIGYAMIPGGNPAIGGGSLGVCKYSERPEDALSFIKWMCSEPISSAASLLGSTSPCRQTYDNYEIINNFPWLNLVKKSFVLAKGNRMPEDINLPFDERKFLNILGMAVKNAYNNICTPEEALVNAQKQFEQYFRVRF